MTGTPVLRYTRRGMPKRPIVAVMTETRLRRRVTPAKGPVYTSVGVDEADAEKKRRDWLCRGRWAMRAEATRSMVGRRERRKRKKEKERRKSVENKKIEPPVLHAKIEPPPASRRNCEREKTIIRLTKWHLIHTHDLDVVWHECGAVNCEYQAKWKGNLMRHKAMALDDDIVRYYCDEAACEYRAKTASHIKKHKTNARTIRIRWHFCGSAGCDYKAKNNGHVTRHKAKLHNICRFTR
jgi:hypothetical protein